MPTPWSICFNSGRAKPSVEAVWACDNAFVAAHNAAVRISTCAKVNGYDVLSLSNQDLPMYTAAAADAEQSVTEHGIIQCIHR